MYQWSVHLYGSDESTVKKLLPSLSFIFSSMFLFKHEVDTSGSASQMEGHKPAAWQDLWTASGLESGSVTQRWCQHIELPARNKGSGIHSLFLAQDLGFTSCLIFFSKGGPLSGNSVTIPDSSASCLITSCRSSTRWDGVWGWGEEWACWHQRKICLNSYTNGTQELCEHLLASSGGHIWFLELQVRV